MGKCEGCGKSIKASKKCDFCGGNFCAKCIPAHNCKKHSSKRISGWIYIISMVLILILLFIVYAASSFTSVPTIKYVVEHQNISNLVSFSPYLNNTYIPGPGNRTFPGFIKRRIDWNGGIGIINFFLVDDYNQEIALYPSSDHYYYLSNILRSSNLSKAKYNINGEIRIEHEGLGIQMLSIFPYTEPKFKEILINRTATPKEQEIKLVPRFPTIRNMVKNWFGIEVLPSK